MSRRSGPSSPRASASSGTRAPRRVSNFERQSNYHRLSKFPDRYTAKLSAAPEDPSDLTPFATNFYREHPDEEDLSTPEEKLEQLNSVLDSDASSAERFTALSQKKAMIYLINGDESKEMIDVLRDLGPEEGRTLCEALESEAPTSVRLHPAKCPRSRSTSRRRT